MLGNVFDTEYRIRFLMLVVLGVSVITLAWTYNYKTDVIMELNDTNKRMFIERFEKFGGEAGFVGEWDLESFSQRRLHIDKIDRSVYNLNSIMFSELPVIPDDWADIRYAFSKGRMFAVESLDQRYYLQPEFYDDWFTNGIYFYRNPERTCKSGFVVEPSVQKVAVDPGSSVRTFGLIRSSFCVDNYQPISFDVRFPRDGNTFDGVDFNQNVLVAEEGIDVSVYPNSLNLGPAFPMLNNNWVYKFNIDVDVDDDIIPGIYVVAIHPAEYKPYYTGADQINYNAYRSTGGKPVMYIVLAVDDNEK